MPVSLFGMVPITTAQQRFTCVDPILQPQLPTAVRLAVATFPRGSAARPSGGGYSVPSASHPRVTPNARPGRVPVAEHRIFVSLISTRATSCRTSPVGVGASVLPQWRGAIVPKPAEATCRAHPTRRQAIRAGGGAARAAAKRRPRGEAVPGAGRSGPGPLGASGSGNARPVPRARRRCGACHRRPGGIPAPVRARQRPCHRGAKPGLEGVSPA